MLGVDEGREDLGRLLTFTYSARGSLAGWAVKHCGEAGNDKGANSHETNVLLSDDGSGLLIPRGIVAGGG